MNTLLKNWDLLRIVRLLVGLLIIFMSIAENQIILSIIGVLLLIQAVLNFGCGPNGCDINSNRRYKRRS